MSLIDIDATPFLGLLPPRVAEELLSLSVLVKYSNGQLIHTRGELKPGLSIVHSGAAHVGVNGIDGTFVTAAALGQGECFGEFTLFTDLPRTHDISSIGESQIYQISKSKFDALYEREASISRALLKTTLTRTHILLETLDALRRLPILERTAKTLLTMSYTLGRADSLIIKQSDLAYSLGVTRVSMAKALKQLASIELIELGYGRINFLDRDALAKWVQQHCGISD